MHTAPYTNTYTYFPLIPASSKILEEFSRTITHILQAYPGTAPLVHNPSHFHLTCQYAGDIDDMSAYVATTQAHRHDASPARILCDGIGTWKSNHNDHQIIYLQPTEIVPYSGVDMPPQHMHDTIMHSVITDTPTHNIPHITICEIVPQDATFALRFWMQGFIRMMDAWQHHEGDAVLLATDSLHIAFKNRNHEKIHRVV